MTIVTIILALAFALLVSVPWILVLDRLLKSHHQMHWDLSDLESEVDVHREALSILLQDPNSQVQAAAARRALHKMEVLHVFDA